MLQARYPAPAYALFPEVRNATGFSASRSADAIAMGLYPSRGLVLEGFELKVSRSDWLRELRRPEKAETIMRYCDRIWLVAATKDMVPPEELPAAWGLMVPQGGALRIRKQAPDRPASERRELDRAFLASLLRNAHSYIRRELQNAAHIEAARKEGRREGESTAASKVERLERAGRDLQERVERFERESGVRIADAWNIGDISAAVKMVVSGGHLDLRRRLELARGEIDRILQSLGADGLPPSGTAV
jgi:hypothetical protein